MSVSTLSNEDYRKRAPSQMKAKYKSGQQTQNTSRVQKRRQKSPRQHPGISNVNNSPILGTVESRNKDSSHNRLYSAIRGASSSKKILDGGFSDQNLNEHQINEDISQFLNTKQTFNNSVNGVTNNDLEKEVLERNSRNMQRKNLMNTMDF